MKKTIIALMALAGMAVAGTDTNTLTLSSKVSGTQASGFSESFDLDAFSKVIGETAATVDALTTGGKKYLDGDNNSFEYDDTIAYTLKLENMLQSGNTTLDVTKGLALTSIEIIGRDNGGDKQANATLSLTIGTKTYTSNKPTYSTSTGYQPITFTFTDGPVLTSLSSDLNITVSGFTSGYLGLGAFKTQSDATLTGVSGNGYVPLVRVNLSTVPEPTTATLSLLALAGLAARRRRK